MGHERKLVHWWYVWKSSRKGFKPPSKTSVISVETISNICLEDLESTKLVNEGNRAISGTLPGIASFYFEIHYAESRTVGILDKKVWSVYLKSLFCTLHEIPSVKHLRILSELSRIPTIMFSKPVKDLVLEEKTCQFCSEKCWCLLPIVPIIGPI